MNGDPWNLKYLKGRAKARKQQVSAIPGVFKFKTLLYIGAKPDRIEMVDLFLAHRFTIDILEVWRPNIEALRKANEQQRIFRTIFEGDVRRLMSYSFFPIDIYDVTMFWHGLEHLKKEEIHATVKGIERITKFLVIFGCPIGKYEQDEVEGNVHEKHLSFLEPKDFHRMGYRTSTVRPNKPRGSNLCAWKFLT